MKTKKHLRKHASRRACSRFDFDYNNAIYEQACKAITFQTEVGVCKPIVFLEKSSLTKTLWLIEISGNRVVAVYDKKRKAIATFMPVEYHEELVKNELSKVKL